MDVLRTVCPWLIATGIVMAGGGLGGGCYAATQASLVIETDVDCSSVGQTAITIGANADETETLAPVANAIGCTYSNARQIGTLVMVPSDARDAKFAVRIVTGPDPSSCTKDNKYAGCIVARRSLRYIEHQSLRLPIAMRESCRDVPCAPATETCVRGRCVPSEIPAARCLGEGCTEDAFVPDPGPLPDAGAPEAGDAGCVPACAGRTRTTCASGQRVDEICATPCASGTCAVATDIVAGSAHTCALLSNGDVHCWGANAAQQLGFGPDPASSSRPTNRVALTAQARSFGGASAHTCVLTTTNEAVCWGANGDGQAANDLNPSAAPTLVTTGGGEPVVALAVGGAHTCLASAASLHCRGRNTNLQLGAAVAGRVVTIAGISPTSLAAGGAFGCMTDTVSPAAPRCWGDNGRRQLGTLAPGDVDVNLATAVAPLPGGLAQIAAGSAFACARASGQVHCWGAGDLGQLGGGASPAESNVPVHVAIPGDDVAHVAAGTGHACAVKNDGATYCWGANATGQLGGPGANASTPRLVPIPPAIRVATGASHSCALLRSREVRCWGLGDSGQLGNGETSPTPAAPAPVLWP